MLPHNISSYYAQSGLYLSTLTMRRVCSFVTRRFQGSFGLGEPLTLWDENQYWQGIFLLSLRRNQSADAFRDSVKEEPTSVDLSLAETLGTTFMDIRMIQLDARGVKTYMDGCKDVNPLYLREQRCNVSLNASAHLNVNPMYCNVHSYLYCKYCSII